MRTFFVVLILLGVSLRVRLVMAEAFTFTQVFEPGTYRAMSGAVNNLGEVAFLGYTHDGQQRIVSTNLDIAIETSDGFFTKVGTPDINDQGEVVFWAESAGFEAIYASKDGEIDIFASTQTFATFKAGTFNPTPSNPRINNNGDISFYAKAEIDGEPFEAIFSGPDPMTDILVHGRRDARGLSRGFTLYHDTNDFGEIAFSTNNSHRGIDILHGSPPNFELVASGKCDPGSRDCFAAETPFNFVSMVPQINNRGDVAFNGSLDDGQQPIGFVLRDGETVPEVVGVGFGIGQGSGPAILDDGRIVFGNSHSSDYVGEEGIFIVSDAEVDSVILAGETLFDEEIGSVFPINVSGNGVILMAYQDLRGDLGLAVATPHAVPLGDFDTDLSLTSNDLDILTSAVRSGSTRLLFDLSGNGLVDEHDRSFWVDELSGTVVGDADFDRDVDFSDFTLLANNFSLGDRWSTGDFDGNGKTEFNDFLMLSRNFGFVGSTSAVPESTSTLWSFVSGLVLLLCRRDKR